MYLLKTNKCEECNLCLDFCPISKDPRIQNCKHCPDAPCKEACKYDAFYETNPGVYEIDTDLCVGCGDCIEACPYNAIVLEEGIAKKCNLCGECISHCPLKAIKIVETEEEKREKEQILGWKYLTKGEKSGVYKPSIQEVRMIDKFLKVHRELVKTSSVNLEDLLDEFFSAHDIELKPAQRTGLLNLIKQELIGFSVIDPFLGRPDIEEIAIIRGAPIRIFKRGEGWLDTDVSITSEEKIIEIANKMAYSLNRRLTAQEPRMNASLPDGSRLHVIIPPIAKEATITIRKFTSNPFSPRELIENGTITANALAYLWLACQMDTNMLIAGSTGSGKTTTLNTILSFIPKDQRIITIEETPELNIYHPHHVRLIVNKERKVTMTELVRDTLRMRPDKVVVGEIRSKEEIEAWIDTTLAGQGKGSFATFHALSAREAINRFKSKGISETDLSGLDVIVIQRRWTDRDGNDNRRVFEIAEVLWDEKVHLKPIFNFNTKKMTLIRTKNTSKIIDHARNFLGIHANSELKKRARFLEHLPKEYYKAFEEISKWGRA